MRKKERSYLFYLEDMLESINKIQHYIKDKSFADFLSDFMLMDAVVRNLEIIGEASKSIPKTVKDKYSEIPWMQMYRMRNRISHEYFGLDEEVIWKIATQYLPNNKADLERIIKSEEKN